MSHGGQLRVQGSIIRCQLKGRRIKSLLPSLPWSCLLVYSVKTHGLVSCHKYHKVGKQQKCILPQFWRPKSKLSITGPKSRCQQGCAPSRGSRGENPFLAPSSCGGHQHCLACGHIVKFLSTPSVHLLCVCVCAHVCERSLPSYNWCDCIQDPP